MQRVRLLLAVPVACVFGCGDATQPALPPVTSPPLIFASTQAIPDSGVAFTLCLPAGGYANIDVEPAGGGHFDTLSVVHRDTAGNTVTQCGNLTFADQVHTFSATFATDDADDLWPYVFWWRGSRRKSVGTYDTLTLWDSTPSPHDLVSTGDLAMPLGTDYDGVGTVLWKSSTPHTIRDSAFLCNNCPNYPVTDIQYRMQYWRHADAPTALSAQVTDSVVALTWQNHHQGRAADSTIVFRDGDEIARLDHTATSYADTVANGTYLYSLKHLAAAVIASGGLANPNSGPSNDTTVTVNVTPPDPLAMYVDGTDWITEDGWYTWDMVRSGGTPPYGPHRWDYRPHTTSTWTQVGTDSTYTRFVHTTDTWFWLRAAVWDAAGDSIVDRRWAVEISDGGEAPMLLATQVGIRLRDGSCSPRLPVGEPGRQAWLQMIMESVARIEYCRVETGTP